MNMFNELYNYKQKRVKLNKVMIFRYKLILSKYLIFNYY